MFPVNSPWSWHETFPSRLPPPVAGSRNKPPHDNSDVAAANAWKNLGNNLALALGKLAAKAKAAGTLADGALAFGFAFAFGALAASCTYRHGSRLHVPEG